MAGYDNVIDAPAGWTGSGGGYTGAGSSFASGLPSSAPQVQAPTLTAPWGASGPQTYQPGQVGMSDIPDFTPASLQGQMANPTLDAYYANLLANPSTLDAHAVDTMKASMKDTLAEQQQTQEQDLQGMGANYGIGDSPWLASERLGSRRSRDQAIAQGAQNIDVEAAKTRQADRLNVGSAASGYQNQKAQQVMQTVSAGLQRAAAIGDRTALQESVKQAAASSGQSSQRIMADWLMQQAGLSLDYTKLNQQSAQFLEDLMMRKASLDQADAQFGASYGLDLNRFNASEQHYAAEHPHYAAEHPLGSSSFSSGA
jgi:hypothetical protein